MENRKEGVSLIYQTNQKQQIMTQLIIDKQTRITRYGMKCFQIIDGIKCHAYAYAKKKNNNLIISENYNDLIDANGNCVSGTYKILSIGNGKIANINCEKIN